MAREKRLFYRRTFLNKPDHHSSALIIAKVVRNTWRDSVTVGVTLQIADCTRKVELDFYGGGTEAQRQNDLFKLDTLVNTISRVRDLLEAEYDRIPALLREID